MRRVARLTSSFVIGLGLAYVASALIRYAIDPSEAGAPFRLWFFSPLWVAAFLVDPINLALTAGFSVGVNFLIKNWGTFGGAR